MGVHFVDERRKMSALAKPDSVDKSVIDVKGQEIWTLSDYTKKDNEILAGPN